MMRIGDPNVEGQLDEPVEVEVEVEVGGVSGLIGKARLRDLPVYEMVTTGESCSASNTVGCLAMYVSCSLSSLVLACSRNENS